ASRTEWIETVDRKTQFVRSMCAQHIDDFRTPCLRAAFSVAPRVEERPADCMTQLEVQAQPFPHMLTAMKLPTDDTAIGEYHHIPRRVASRPNLHVRCIRGIADIHRVIEQYRGTVGLS